MQPHWIEPAPLGEAQRVGMYQSARQAELPQIPGGSAGYDPRVIQDQMRYEQARLTGAPAPHSAPGGLGGMGGLGGFNAAGALGVGVMLLGAGVAGYFLGRSHGTKKTTKRLTAALGERELKQVLGNSTSFLGFSKEELEEEGDGDEVEEDFEDEDED